MSPAQICVVGAGRVGILHASNYRDNVPGASLAALVDVNEARLRKAADQLQVEASFTTLEEALHRADFDAVCITTPTPSHAAIAVAAANAGKHIFCEKPIAVDVLEADAMISAAQQANIILQIGYMRRFDPAFRAAHRRLQRGEIGEVMMIRSLTRGPALPPEWVYERGNGMLAEVNSHDFDTLRWFGNSDFARVYVEATSLKRPDLKDQFPSFYDNAVVTARLRNGIVGQLDGACPVEYGYDARVEILGTKGVMFIGGLQRLDVTVCTAEAGVNSATYPSWSVLFHTAFIEEARHFVDCIIHDRAPAVTGADAKAALLAVQAANESIRSGQPVEI